MQTTESLNDTDIQSEKEKTKHLLNFTKIFVAATALTTTVLFGYVLYNEYIYFDNSLDPAKDLENNTSVYTLHAYTNVTFTNDKRKGHLVWSRNCQTPEIKPSDVVWPPKIYSAPSDWCNDLPQLTRIVRGKSGYPTLVFDQDAAPYFNNQSAEMKCCYSVISRNIYPGIAGNKLKPHKLYRTSKCIYFTHKVTFFNREELIYVKCSLRNISYVNSHAICWSKNEVSSKRGNPHESHRDKLNVHIIGVDGYSRLKLINSFEGFYEELLKDWIEFKGYSKIGGKKLDNDLALLTGMEPSSFYKWDSIKNSIRFIWSEYSDEGYKTFYSEGYAEESLFGFENSFGAPNHLFLPSILTSESLDINDVASIGTCWRTDFISLDYFKLFLKCYKNDHQFSLLWFNEFRGNGIHDSRSMQELLNRYLTHLNEMDAYNRSLIVFLSNQGRPSGKKLTYDNWIEERQPFLFFRFPDWWKRLYPIAFRSVIVNSNRLTTPYDVHSTLKGILKRVNSRASWSKGKSLFIPVPANRGCTDAGVPMDLCICKMRKKEFGLTLLVQDMAIFIVEYVNQIIFQISPDNYIKSARCSTTGLKRILSAIKTDFPNNTVDDRDEYFITIETYPGNAQYEATVQYTGESPYFKLVDEVTRVDRNVSQSDCLLRDDEANKYCICVHNQ